MDFWNYIDLLMPFLIMWFTIEIAFVGGNGAYLRSFYAFSSLMLWAKLVSFLRIYQKTAYLIGMIAQVVFDMKIFLLILVLVIMGFGHAFLALSQASDNEEDFVNGNFMMAIAYSYRVSMGDFDTTVYDACIEPISAYILWILSTLITMVVMFNLLIAIISETFATYNEHFILAGT